MEPPYVGCYEMRPMSAMFGLAARGTAWARAQVTTLRLELLKIGAQLVASVRRLVLRLPAAFPFRDGWSRIALQGGATPG